METEFETEIDDPESIRTDHISGHIAIYCKIDSIAAELSGISPAYRTDEEFCDVYGLNRQTLRLLKRKIKDRLLHEAQIKQSD